MLVDQAWLRYLILLAFYLFFEAIYRAFRNQFWATHMIEEMLATVRTLKVELESDKDGARLCAWIVSIILIVSPLLIVIFCVASVVKVQSLKDIITCIILLVFMLPITLCLRLFNELCMSWIKKLRAEK